MKKIIALFTAMAFALTLGVAFAEEMSAPSTTAPKAEATPAKKKAAKKKKKKKAAAAKTEAAPATMGTATK